jgi:hypothetical protein
LHNRKLEIHSDGWRVNQDLAGIDAGGKGQ